MKKSDLPEGVNLEWMGDRYRQIAEKGALAPYYGWELIIPDLLPVTIVFAVKSERLALKKALQFLKSRGFK